ncbi:hypothetical protein [Bradyrhizobium sp. 6(2017)]|uniref:hypothetical protein n=1 Tax=Bradyrhizobium sp. 6(2017) TaxID=1197460 RepID=UPI0013E15036|nr:hypothetical protein [Bradyrhizobium sp. 6(2017)]QIG92144.1 hypothetical protein G6P99_06255 [Bradyrhizobium sp. 6(2017)]
MNMFVSSAAVAAAAPAAAIASGSQPQLTDNEAILARVEQIVDLLRTRYVREGWKIDEDQAALTLEYFRRRVHGPAFKDEDEDTAAYYEGPLEFFRSHGQSLDWAHDGNPVGMICGLAKHSKRANEATDAGLLALEEEIFREFELAHANHDEINRLDNICRDELIRLRAEEGLLADDDHCKRVTQMTEFKDYNRLVNLAQPHWDRVDAIIVEMESINAQTAAGRRAKVSVLLHCIMPHEWLKTDDKAEWEIKKARDLLFELVGGEPSEELREQFAAAPGTMVT